MEDTARLDRSRNADARQRTLRPRRLLAAVGVWVGLAVLAILNAGVRETLVSPVVGDYWGHVASTATFLSGLAIVSHLYFGRRDHSVEELVVVSVAWPLMTVLFEFGFGHYVMDNSWDALLADYDLLAGRVWVFVPLAMAVVPLLFGRYLKR